MMGGLAMEASGYTEVNPFNLPLHLKAGDQEIAGFQIVVTLDGAEVRDVLEAHTGEGWLVRAKRNAEGRFYTDDGETVATERLTGLVEARFCE